MHSSLNRVQAVFGFFTTVALVVAGLAALSTLLFPTADTSVAVSLKNVQVAKGRPHYYSTKREEYAQIRFDLDADLSPLFNWNTKQVFVYVYATYSSSDKKESKVPLTEAIIWDAIIPASPSPYSFDALSEKVLSAIPPSIIPASLKPAKKSSQKKRPAAKKSTKKGAAAVAEEDTPGKLRLRGQKAKYQISDITGRLAERENVTLSAGWNVQPWVGALWWSPGTGTVPRTQGTVVNSEAFDFPPLKVAAKKEGV
ncbi:Signal peptidase 22kDa subunit [Penicillium lagena]|uniref:Signal peptidase 22kDa subunit n=1 Tax=Penicillium lagena TaxID=94218 RepID=UPI002540764E|nr:Signal peptidase 22kDa subunit [Penicillium lagena]KAJ5620822.1 Signal peptidase 22kDa subunit [Penicillium lagena]